MLDMPWYVWHNIYMAHSKSHLNETGATCPNCQTYFEHAEVEYDGAQAYTVLEVTPCAVPDCGVMLCGCCSKVHASCCGQIICSEHAIAVTSTAPNGTTCIDQFCPMCFAAMLEAEAEALETAPRCPECASTALHATRYDFGTDPETGYHECGERFECRACGATGDAAEVTQARELPAGKPMGVAEVAAPKIFKSA
jgi:hypothetical protein